LRCKFHPSVCARQEGALSVSENWCHGMQWTCHTLEVVAGDRGAPFGDWCSMGEVEMGETREIAKSQVTNFVSGAC